MDSLKLGNQPLRLCKTPVLAPLLEPSWLEALSAECQKPYMHTLHTFLTTRKKEGAEVYPQAENVFNAFNKTPFSAVKIVILGQDPYHNPGQAHGLSFSVPQGVPIPPSLKNIYREITETCGGSVPNHGNLNAWAEQGVLLLNAVLTVEKNTPGAHRNKGWEKFTDHVIEVLNKQGEGIVFMLWGTYARSKKKLIDCNKHLVLEAPHPSPLSAYRGFFGCEHFKKANIYLKTQQKEPITWFLH